MAGWYLNFINLQIGLNLVSVFIIFCHELTKNGIYAIIYM